MLASFSFRVVIFDLDGTLIDSLADVAKSVNRVLADAGLSPIEGALQKSLLGEGARARVRKAFEVKGVRLSNDELSSRTGDFTRYYAANLLDQTKPYDGAQKILETLSKFGIRTAVCTNKDEASARYILSTLGMMPPIEDVAGADTFGVQKPHPDHIRKLLLRMNADPRHTLLVGDSTHDIKAAHAAGIVCAAVAWGYSSTPVELLGANVILRSFDELLDPALFSTS